MKVKTYFTYFFVIVFMLACKNQPKEKQLFILSGQSNMEAIDPEISFIPTLAKALGKENILVVKDAEGGQPIRRWYRNWPVPEGDTLKMRPDLYDRLLKKIDATTRNHEIGTITFIWMQGERDARMQWGELYKESLLGLYNQISKDLQRSDLHFIIGRLSDFDMQNEKYPDWTKIRDIQMKVAESQPYFDWINTDDLNDGLNAKGQPIHNDLHMSVKGYELLGQRFAKKAIELIQSE